MTAKPAKRSSKTTAFDRHPMPGPPLAIAAEALFIINLLLLPGLAFAALMVLWARHHRHPNALVRNHLRQAGWTSIWGGMLLVTTSLSIFLLGGFDNPWSWMIGLLYFIAVHSTLILFGVLGLARAMNDRPWRYPLLGPRTRGSAAAENTEA